MMPPGSLTASGGSVLPSIANPNPENINEWMASTSNVLSNFGSSIRQRFKYNQSIIRNRTQGATKASNNTQALVPVPRYIHWCVDSATRQTLLHHICIEEKKGKAFVEELRQSYRRLRGWKWWFSLLTCEEIRLTKVSQFPFSEVVDLIKLNNEIKASFD
jgi:hypothetical protein